MKVIRMILVAGIAVTLMVVPYLYFRDTRECLRGYQEEYMVPGWTQYILIGTIMTPIFHAPRRATRYVCEEWQEELR